MTDFSTLRMVMVDTQVRPSDVTKFPIINALSDLPRERFVPNSMRDSAYMGEHIAISEDRVLLDARSFAKMLDAVDVQPNEMVLNIGGGMGYGAAVLSRMAEAVVFVEKEKFAEDVSDLFFEVEANNVIVETGDPVNGAPTYAPYDVIIIEGGIEKVPSAVSDQLKVGGRIIALFQDGPYGVARIGLKSNHAITWRDLFHAHAPVLPGFEKEKEFSL